MTCLGQCEWSTCMYTRVCVRACECMYVCVCLCLSLSQVDVPRTVCARRQQQWRDDRPWERTRQVCSAYVVTWWLWGRLGPKQMKRSLMAAFIKFTMWGRQAGREGEGGGAEEKQVALSLQSWMKIHLCTAKSEEDGHYRKIYWYLIALVLLSGCPEFSSNGCKGTTANALRKMSHLRNIALATDHIL